MFIGKMPTSAAALSSLKTDNRRINDRVGGGMIAGMGREPWLRRAREITGREEENMIRNERPMVSPTCYLRE
jgi:hypothetical protein